jgi:hypothetical protein
MENSFLMRGVRRAGSLAISGRLDVSRSGYYDWRSRAESATSQRREELKLLIEKAFDMSDDAYGHRRIQDQLDRWGVTACLGLFCRLVRELVLEPSSHGRRVDPQALPLGGGLPPLVRSPRRERGVANRRVT